MKKMFGLSKATRTRDLLERNFGERWSPALTSKISQLVNRKVLRKLREEHIFEKLEPPAKVRFLLSLISMRNEVALGMRAEAEKLLEVCKNDKEYWVRVAHGLGEFMGGACQAALALPNKPSLD